MPCDRSLTVSLSGQRVAVRRRFRSARSASGTLTRKGRIGASWSAARAGVTAVTRAATAARTTTVRRERYVVDVMGFPRRQRSGSLGERQERLALLDDVGGELGAGHAAGVLRAVDRAGRDEQHIAGRERHRR